MATIAVTNPGNDTDIQPNLQIAFNAAVDGDIVTLPPGKFICNSTATCTKKITLLGGGVYNTTLYRYYNPAIWSTEALFLSQLTTWKNMVHFDINSVTTTNTVKVYGINFLGSPLQSETLGADTGLKITHAKNFVIANNNFQHFGQSGIHIIHDLSDVGGVIYKNRIYNNSRGSLGLGLGYGIEIYGSPTGGGSSSFIADPELGTSKFIFIENNAFQFHRHTVAAGGCAKYVARYNSIFDNVGASTYASALDGHSPRGVGNGSNEFGTRAIEIYNNTVVNARNKDLSVIVPGSNVSDTQEIAFLSSAGDLLVYNNYVRGYRFCCGVYSTANTSTATFVTDTPLGPSTIGPRSGSWVYPADYPVPQQAGYRSGIEFGTGGSGNSGSQASGDMFAWNNDFIPHNSSGNSVMFYNYGISGVTGFYTEGRDYHLRPKPGYTPYTYPHPLRIS